jgi:hypothetical protein
MPCRNVLPKPFQKPHPPIWLACSRRETIHAGDGFRYFGNSLGHYYVFGDHLPGQTNIWQRFEQARNELAEVGRGSGKNRHEHICEAMELFAQLVISVPQLQLRTDRKN